MPLRCPPPTTLEQYIVVVADRRGRSAACVVGGRSSSGEFRSGSPSPGFSIPAVQGSQPLGLGLVHG